jgi:uncharacterized membrane-anchored protein YjiN (DUF445 family)
VNSISRQSTFLADDAARRSDLLRHKLYATGLLGIMIGGLVGARLLLHGQSAGPLIEAACEAGIVGGFADWFAVTALFRRPLGLPIPHTAIVPRAHHRIADGLGKFVADHLLDPEIMTRRLHDSDPSLGFARWLARPQVSAALAERISNALPVVLNAIEDDEIREFLSHALESRAKSADIAPWLARTSRGLRDTGELSRMIDALIEPLRAIADASGPRIEAEVALRSSWWVPRAFDRRIATALTDGISEWLEELSRPTGSARMRLEAAVDQWIARLEQDPLLRDEVDAWKLRVLAQPAVKNLLARSWDEAKAMLSQSAGGSDPALARGIALSLSALGNALAEDQIMRDHLNRRVQRIVMGTIVPFRTRIGEFVSDVVQSWDAPQLSRRLELAVGKDLQFIRMSGTLVGALVGTALYLINQFL